MAVQTSEGHAVALVPLGLARASLSALETLVQDAPAAEASSWAWEERAGVIAVLDRIGELAALYRARLLVAQKEDGRWARSGDRTFENHRARITRAGLGAARREAELGRGLSELPGAERAVADGAVGLGHVQVLGRLHADGSAAVRDALVHGGAQTLLAIARSVDVPTFSRRAAAWAAGVDAQRAEEAFEQVRLRRYHRCVDRDGGTKIDAFVDPVVGAAWRTALEALTPVPAADDVRTSEQRAADALATLANRVLETGLDKIGAQVRPHLSLLVPAETWAAVRSRPRRGRARDDKAGPPDGDVGSAGGEAGRAGGEAGMVAGEAGMVAGEAAGDGPPVPAAELDDGTAVPMSVLERLACDCELTRVVLDADGVPLDVGQTQRTYAKGLRRAVLVRDGHCQWPGCTVRATWCEVHHRVWFSRGGPTSVANGIALCVFHHHEVHRRRIEIAPTKAGHTFARPDGAVIGTTDRTAGVLRLIAPPGAEAGGAGGPRPPGGSGWAGRAHPVGARDRGDEPP